VLPKCGVRWESDRYAIFTSGPKIFDHQIPSKSWHRGVTYRSVENAKDIYLRALHSRLKVNVSAINGYQRP